MAVRAWLVASGLAAGAACAADPGDAVRRADDGGQDTVAVEASSGGGDDGGGVDGSGFPEAGGGDDANPVVVPDAGTDSTLDAASPTPDAGAPETNFFDASGDAAACLQDAGSCAVCATQNASDKPVCMQYIQCFEQNNCNPHNSCGSMDAVCGVNKIGGGNAPYSAAVATYDCACH